MGYILPIEPYQQMNVPLREVQRRTRNVQTLDRLNPVKPIQHYVELRNRHEKLQQTEPKINRNRYDEDIAAITGKGIHFDQTI